MSSACHMAISSAATFDRIVHLAHRRAREAIARNQLRHGEFRACAYCRRGACILCPGTGSAWDGSGPMGFSGISKVQVMASRSPLRKITDSEFDSDPPAEIAGLLEATHFGHLRRSAGARGIQTGHNRHEDDRTRHSARHLARGPGRRLRRPARMQRKPRLPNAFRHRSANQRRGSLWLLKHPDPQLAEDGHGPLSVSDRSSARPVAPHRSWPQPVSQAVASRY